MSATRPVGYFLFDWEASAPERVAGATPPIPWRTPLSLLIGPARGGSAGVYSLLALGLALLLACAWSLHRARIPQVDFRMEAPRATSASSLAFHSATLCKISIVIAYNVNLLLLGPDAHGWHTPQTFLYCLFAKRSRLVFDASHGGLSYSPRYDYYLLFFPLCLAALILFHHFNLQARLCGSRKFVFAGNGVLPGSEIDGKRRVDYLIKRQRESAAERLQRAARRRWAPEPPPAEPPSGLSLLDRVSRALSFPRQPSRRGGGRSESFPRRGAPPPPPPPNATPPDDEGRAVAAQSARELL